MLVFELMHEVGAPVHRMQLKGNNVLVASRHLHGLLLGFGSKTVRADLPDQSIRLYSPEGRVLHVLEGVHDGAVSVVSCSGEFVVTGGVDGVVAVCKAQVTPKGPVMELLKRLTGHRAKITAAAMSRSWNVVVTAGADNCVILWDLQTMRLLRQLEVVNMSKDRQPAAVQCLCIDEHTGNIAAGRFARTMCRC